MVKRTPVPLSSTSMICLFQVINAARTLAARPRSKAARENMDVFKTSWENQVHLLVDAVDEITGIDEFLAVSGEFDIIFAMNVSYMVYKSADKGFSRL